MFWIAIDENDRVIGCCGYSSIPDTNEVFLHRLFDKSNKKHCGIGSKLLNTVEEYIRSKGKIMIRVHLGVPKEMWFESYSFYPKHGYTMYADRYMKKDLI